MKLLCKAAAPFLLLFAVACGGQSNSALPDTQVAPLRKVQQGTLPLADLSVQITANKGHADVGQSVRFTIVATNNGPSASTLDTHVIPSRKFRLISIQCAFDVSSDGPFCEPGVAQSGGHFTTIVVAKVVTPGNDGMQACALSEGDTSDPNSKNDCVALHVMGAP
jgi:hypothetical protein